MKEKIFNAILNLVLDKNISIGEDTVLIGNGRALDSLKLVEICLVLEEIATENAKIHHQKSDES